MYICICWKRSRVVYYFIFVSDDANDIVARYGLNTFEKVFDQGELRLDYEVSRKTKPRFIIL